MTQLEFIEQIIKEKEAVILDANDKIWSYAELHTRRQVFGAAVLHPGVRGIYGGNRRGGDPDSLCGPLRGWNRETSDGNFR